MHRRDHGGKFGVVSLAGRGEPRDGHRGDPVAPLLLRPRAPSPEAGRDPAPSPPHPPATDEGAAAGTGPGEQLALGSPMSSPFPKGRLKPLPGTSHPSDSAFLSAA